ncbi:hypothetical protein KP509_03G008000 [Ceratopteris richardii]|uniref:Uncharacterized protein n=1 Tax=Ceratopteris richardii TaxID=49495 RepID=A0A8T2V193_CERRI|nr:hypothetical protein KP509_03G008000 [Ceratopteris richardii]
MEFFGHIYTMDCTKEIVIFATKSPSSNRDVFPDEAPNAPSHSTRCCGMAFCYILLLFVIFLLITHGPSFFVIIALLTTLLLRRLSAPFVEQVFPEQPITAMPPKSHHSANPLAPRYSTVASAQKRRGVRGGGGGTKLERAKSDIDRPGRDQFYESPSDNLGDNRRQRPPIAVQRSISLPTSAQNRPPNEGEHEDAEELRRRVDAYIHKVRMGFKTER